MILKRPLQAIIPGNPFQTTGQDLYEILDCMERDGWKQAGYRYILLGDGWQTKARIEEKPIEADPEKFPSGFRNFIQEAHLHEISVGVTLSAGYRSFYGAGSYDWEWEDVKHLSELGIDWIHVTETFTPQRISAVPRFCRMGQAIRARKRNILFTTSHHDLCKTSSWIKSSGSSMWCPVDWEITSYDDFKAKVRRFLELLPCSVMNSYTILGVIPDQAGTDITLEEANSFFLLSVLFGTPLLLFGDPRTASPQKRKVYTDPDLITVDQDADSRPAMLLSSLESDVLKAARLLSDGSFLLGICNLSDQEKSGEQTQISFSDLGFDRSSSLSFSLKNLLSGEDMLQSGPGMDALLKPHEMVLARLYLHS